MDNIRLFLIIAVSFLSMVIWQQWEKDYGPQSAQEASYAYGEESTVTQADVKIPAQSVSVPNAPAVASNDQKSSELPSAPESQPVVTALNNQAQKINVKTDTFDIQIDTKGGSIVKVNLLEYPLSVDRPDTAFPLLTELPANYYIAQSGLIASDKKMAPTHESIFTASADSFEMTDNQDSLVVKLNWKNDSGIEVVKKYEFIRGSHLIRINYEITNNSGSVWTGRQYQQIQRVRPSESGNAFLYTYDGGAIYSEENKYEKITFDEMDTETLNRDIKGGWQAMLQHYFVSAWIPPAEEIHHFYTKALANGRYILGSYSPSQSVESGSSAVISNQFFSGPKLQHELETVAPGLVLTVDYGWLTIISEPIFWVLEYIHALVNNWGWSIILLTILIKAIFYRLSAASYRSMAHMKRFTPRIQTLKERYGDDKQRFQQAMMELYKKEKINPLGGCLPMVVQMPVFIALYYVLIESVEMRQAPWILWIDDLSIMDPYFILPILMGVTMMVQQKLNPPPPDPMQAKIMMMLPIAFTIFFAFFPAGLVLYWFVNNLLSISQQYYVTKKIEESVRK